MSEIETIEAAKRLNLAPQTVTRLCRTGKLKARQISRGTWLIDEDSVADYKASTEGLKKNDPRR